MRYYHVRFSWIKVNDQWQTSSTDTTGGNNIGLKDGSTWLHIWDTCKNRKKEQKTDKTLQRFKRLQHFDCSSDDTLTPIDPLSDVYSHFSVVLNNCFVEPELFFEIWKRGGKNCIKCSLFRLSVISCCWSVLSQNCVSAVVCFCVTDFVKNVPMYQSNTVKHSCLSYLLMTQSLSLGMLYCVAWSLSKSNLRFFCSANQITWCLSWATPTWSMYSNQFCPNEEQGS